MIRGFSTNRLLLTVDGVRMNTAIFRSGNLQNVINIDPLAVERTEVVLGPGSVIYGSDAIGGVMNFFTLRPKFSRDSLRFTGNILARYATANDEQTAHLDFNIGLKKWAFRTSVSINDFGNLRMGSHGPSEYLRNEYALRRDGEDTAVPNPHPGDQLPTGYSQLGILQKVSYKPDEAWKLDAGFIYSSTSDFDRYDALIRRTDDGSFRNAEWFYGPQSWLMTNLQAQYEQNHSFFDRMKLVAAYQNFGESRNERRFSSISRIKNDEQVDAYSLNVDFMKNLNVSHKISYGAEYVLNDIESRAVATDITTGVITGSPTRYPDDSTWESAAVFLLHSWDATEELSLQSGIRYNYIDVNADLANRLAGLEDTKIDLQTDALTGSLGAVWLPNDSWRYTASLGTAFRAPNIDDMGKLFDPDPGTVIVPNPDLKPEYSYTAEVGAGKNFSDNGSVSANTYVTYLDNALAADDFTVNGQPFIQFQDNMRRVQAIQNAESALIYGIELAGRWQPLKDLQVTAHLNKVWGKQELRDGSEVPIRHVAPLFGDLKVNYTQNKWHIELYGQFNGALEFDELAPSQQRRDYLYASDVDGNPYSPSWYVLTARSGYKVTPDLEVVAILENLTDQRYRTYSSGIAAAGRNLIFALKYAF